MTNYATKNDKVDTLTMESYITKLTYLTQALSLFIMSEERDNKSNCRISALYFDRGRFGSQIQTLKEAKKKDSTFTPADIQRFFSQNVEERHTYRVTYIDSSCAIF